MSQARSSVLRPSMVWQLFRAKQEYWNRVDRSSCVGQRCVAMNKRFAVEDFLVVKDTVYHTSTITILRAPSFFARG
eukprot:scaffold34601_cov234-Amphora_coffeaeformis.AAC.6